MEQYQIYATTDGKHIGRTFTVDELNKSIDILGIDEGHRISQYETIRKSGNKIRVSNVNYTLKGIKL
jgi:hypothetical protein